MKYGNKYIISAHRISKEHKKKAIKIGKGNESKGTRMAIETYKLSPTIDEVAINPNK